MREITGQLTEELKNFVGDKSVAQADAYSVSSYPNLMHHIAKLSFLNKDYLLFFRGQDRDYKNKAGASTFYPSIYRGERVSKEEISLKFDILSSVSQQLCDALKKNRIQGCQDVKRRRLIQWSILQHYRVCPTPLLDFTHSLRVACSFAFLSSDYGDPYVFVFGLPYVTNRISVNSEHDIVNIRLLSICPPDALRPYFQEGYLVGTDDVTSDYDSKDELDFNNRLVAKFRLQREHFWGGGFDPIPESALYPTDDKFNDVCKQLLDNVDIHAESASLCKFLQEWHELENLILAEARRHHEKTYSFLNATTLLRRSELIDAESASQLDKLRRLRNRVVHAPNSVIPQELIIGLNGIRSLINNIKILKPEQT